MDAIVLGGGLMGSATSFFLARRGLRVRLIERAAIGAGATVASFGNIRRTGRYLPQMPLAHRSLALWSQLHRLLDCDVEFRATGHLRLIFDTEALAQMRQFQFEAQNWGLEIDELTPADIRRRFPGLGPDAIAASFSPMDGSANPRLMGTAFATAAQRLGAEITDRAGPTTVTASPSGFHVTCDKGQFSAPILINCAGAGGRAIAAQFGEDVPLSVHGPQMGVTEPLPHRIVPVVGMWGADGAYLRQVERGNIVFGGGVKRTDVGPDGFARVDPARLEPQLRQLVRLLPQLRNVAILRQWSGAEGYLADTLPVMGASGTTAGLFHAFGFCGHGFQLGPGVGDTMAELVATGRSETPLAPFSITRFASRP
ncbi:sarcosine oxidase subunit beta [Thioclava dalianensis]|uniref:Sarcosine oxidase subunit beta n=1 Tax=Thioclava dalianensis TaxID=1185766 RepID=A0A074THX3_9RHOB|nr:FAD-binding oxidoreductase [Thioclava dalianensis]KEP71301.1 sarcosine oxidase subunit beta [Thioclava dalianensis]SFM76830.1 sarcosine oxidase subunit beta [Thioclava dalianensis]